MTDIGTLWTIEYGLRIQCNHSSTELRKRWGGKRFTYYLQCLRCGNPVKRIAIKDIADVNTLLDFDEELRRNFHSTAISCANDLRAKLEEREKKEWDRWYENYLQSPQWLEKKRLVLKRNNFICEGCLKNKAKVIHHLSYEHVGDELLFELVALCDECHKKAHRII